MKKGEVWVVEIPGVDGHEQQGLRPAVVMADTRTPVALVIPCTSNFQALRFPYTIRIRPTLKNGLGADSIALVFQLRAIDKRRLQKKLGTIERIVLKEIDRMVRGVLGL